MCVFRIGSPRATDMVGSQLVWDYRAGALLHIDVTRDRGESPRQADDDYDGPEWLCGRHDLASETLVHAASPVAPMVRDMDVDEGRARFGAVAVAICPTCRHIYLNRRGLGLWPTDDDDGGRGRGPPKAE